MSRVLDVQLSEKVSREGISALGRLKSLEQFFFFNHRHRQILISIGLQQDYRNYWHKTDRNYQHHIGLCFEFLPHLHAVAINPLYLDMCLGSQMYEALANVRSPCTLQLRHLELLGLYNISRLKVHLPELKVLRLHDEDACYGRPLTTEQMPKVSKLIIYKIRLEDLMSFILRPIGQQLQSISCRIFRDLSRDGPYGQILDRILEVCPNLSHLGITLGYPYRARLLFSVLRPDTLSQLQTLILRARTLENGLLVQILRQAPLLQSVKLMYSMSDHELRELAELANEGSSMQHLQQMTFLYVLNDPNRADKNLLEEAIVSCCSHCPQLKHITLKACNSKVYPTIPLV
jgi:hypothetical protein